MSVISKIMPDLKAMKYADLTAAMALILIHTHSHTHTHTLFLVSSPTQIDTGNLCLLYFHVAISFKICTLPTSPGTATTMTTRLLHYGCCIKK